MNLKPALQQLPVVYALLTALVVAAPAARAQTAPARLAADAAKTDEVVRLDAFTVTGSNIKRMEQETFLPISVYTAADIQNIGAPTVAEILEFLPYSQNININEADTTANGARGDVSTVNLRNLGAGNTLVLLNGRRMSAHGVTPFTPPVTFVNLSSIPAGAIERIEVLRDGASAIYGSDAIGGVVNTILKHNYTGFELSTRYSTGSPSRHETSVDLAGGINFNDNKSNLTLIFSYYDRDPLMSSQRSYSAHTDNRLKAPAPWSSLSGINRGSSSGPWGRFTAVTDAGVAVGVTGITPTTGTTTGRFYYDPVTGVRTSSSGPTAYWDFQGEGQLIGSTTRRSFYSTLDHRFDDRLSAFGELSYYQADSQIQSGTTPISESTDGVIVPKTNYYNPVGTRFFGPGTANPTGTPRNVMIRNYRPMELGPRTNFTDSNAFRLLGGLRGKLGRNWDFETAALYMRGRVFQDSRNAMSQSRLIAALAKSSPDAMNPFGGPDVNPPSVIDSFRITAWDDGIGTLGLVDAKASGALFELPGGSLTTALGGEVRREKMSQRNDPFGLADDVIAQSEQIDIDAQRDVYAAYAEVLVPIFGKQKRAPLVHMMELRVAARFEDFGKASSLKPGASFSWALTDWFMLRSSYNEGFRAASITELFQPQRRRRNFLLDTARAGQEDASDTVSKLVNTGGNPNLRPEKSKAHNFGAVIDVKPIKGLSLSVDVYEIKQIDRIDSPVSQTELNLDAALWRASKGSNARVVRQAQTPADVALGIPGKLIELQGTYQNLASRTVAGVDSVLLYRIPEFAFGRFTLRAEGSFTSVLEQIDAQGNFTSLLRQTANPKWKGNAGLSWSKGSWSASTLVKYVSDYEDDSAYDVAGVPWVIKSWTTVNANIGYLFKSGPLKGTRLRVGANNLFDRDPPLVISVADSFDTSYHDARGLMWWVQTEFRF